MIATTTHRAIRLSVAVLACLACLAGRAADVTVILDAAVGTNALVVMDAQSNVLARIGDDGRVVSGGLSNEVSGVAGAVSGGINNLAAGYAAVVGGGGGYDALTSNVVGNAASGPFSTIGGGLGNLVDSGAWYGTVGGGYFNNAATGSATIAGGFYNGAYGLAGTVGGGYYNSAAGDYATVPGGADSHASGDYAFAAGRGALATNMGSFVWADSTPAYVASEVSNQFTVRASGGVKFYADSAASTGVELPAGGNGWSATSDQRLKENVTPVDGDAVLAAVATLPVSTWNMRTQNPAIRHIGPMAQDFYAAFGVGETNTHIGYSDADGVTLAALQSLLRLVREQEATNAALNREVSDLRARLDALETSGPAPSE